MARTLPKLGQEKVAEVEAAWRACVDERDRVRLLVLRLVAQHELTAAQIAEAADVSRASVFNYLDAFTAGGAAKARSANSSTTTVSTRAPSPR